MAFFYILRHGATSMNNPKAEKLRGWSSVGLSAEGESQARAAGRWLSSKGITRVFASDLKRTKQTTEIISNYLKDAKIAYNARLRDWDTGAMEGMYVEAMKPFLDVYQRHPNYILPEGESYGEYWSRWSKVLKEITDWAVKNPSDRGLFVTHARNVVTSQHMIAHKTIGPVSYEEVPLPGGIMRVDISDNGKLTIKQAFGKTKEH